MAKDYCLTVEVKSSHIAGGVGFMVAFTLPSGYAAPADHPEFETWRDGVRAAVMRTGDQVFHHDAYTRKLAIANLMHELADLNRGFDLQVGGTPGTPAVQIHSTNPFDSQIEADFTGEDGAFRVIEKNPAHVPSATVAHNGKTGLIEAGRKNFPFDKPPAEAPRKQAASAKRPAHK